MVSILHLIVMNQLDLTSPSIRCFRSEIFPMIRFETTTQWNNNVIFITVIDDNAEDLDQDEKQRKVTEIETKAKKEFTRSYNKKIRAQQPHKSKAYNKATSRGGIHNKRYFR